MEKAQERTMARNEVDRRYASVEGAWWALCSFNWLMFIASAAGWLR